jgi:uncharacterized membrane-anchored protein YhcB (DUF1043 family)
MSGGSNVVSTGDNADDILETLQGVLTWDDAVDREVRRSVELAKGEFYTEATLRLGRALEAGIYAVARLMNIDLTATAKVNYELESVQSKLEEAQDKIWLSRSPDNIALLTDVMKKLSDAMATLIQSPNEQLKKTGKTQARSNSKLYLSLADKVTDSYLKNRLRSTMTQVIKVQNIRNNAAHAALDGSEREIDKADFEELISTFINAMEILFEVFIAGQSRITEAQLLGRYPNFEAEG